MPVPPARRGRRCVHPGAPPTDRAPSLRPNGGTGAAVSSQPTAPARRRADELGPPSLGVAAAAVRVVFGTRVVGVTLVHCPCRVPRAASGSRRAGRMGEVAPGLLSARRPPAHAADQQQHPPARFAPAIGRAGTGGQVRDDRELVGRRARVAGAASGCSTVDPPASSARRFVFAT